MFMMYIQEVHIVPKRTTSPVLEFLKNTWGARNRVGIGFSYRSARLFLRIDSWAP